VGAAAAPVVLGPARAQAASGKVKPVTGLPTMKHAVGDPRGIDIAVTSGRNAEARYGLMFKKLPAFAPDDTLLTALAEEMVDPSGPLTDVRLSNDGFDNHDMPAGYTYVGQFIDHDMTRDETPLSEQNADPKGLQNFDTPAFDLGSVYGRGPDLDPALYDPAKRGRLLLVEHDGVLDLPRHPNGTAIIGDARNDENLIICQLQVAFIRLHNHFLDRTGSFEAARQQTRWHFQWMIVNDFLAHVVGKNVVDKLLSQKSNGTVKVASSFYKPKNPLRPMMPVEYSAAAYRFGHSMIRAEYELRDVPQTDDSPEQSLTLPIFATDGRDLRGSRPLPGDLWIDWNYFFSVPGLDSPDDRNMARLIDTQVARPLHDLPETVVLPMPGAVLALAERNLLRGKRLGLPCGQDVAVAMGVKPLDNVKDLGLSDPGWGGKAPLWFYILKEAELAGGKKLGPVGGRIVADVILGVLAADKTSYFNAKTRFQPVVPQCRMGDLLQLCGAV
ncbi:MAG: heme peroxidase family protein, partial [Nocardioidaceae bacterium]